MTVQNVFQTMFNDQDGFFFLPVNLINQVNCGHSHRRVQRRKRFVKKQDFFFVVHDTGQSDFLLLSARYVKGRLYQKIFHSD